MPNALPTKTAPGTFSWKRFPPWGSTAVTPVRTRVALDERRLADAHAGDVGDRVERARLEDAGAQAEVARPRTRPGRPHAAARARYSPSGSCTSTGRARGSSQATSRSSGAASKAVQPAVTDSGPARRCRKMQLPPPGSTGASLWPTHTTSAVELVRRRMSSAEDQSFATAASSTSWL